MPANGQSSDPLHEDSVSSASTAGQTASPTTPTSPTKAQPSRQAARLATTIPSALDTHGSKAGATADTVSQKKDSDRNEAMLHPGPGRLPAAQQESQQSFVVLAVGMIGVLFVATTLLLTWSFSSATMVGTFIQTWTGSWFPSSFFFSTQSPRRRKSSKKRRKSATRWYQRLFSLLLLTSLLSGTFAMGFQHAEAATTAPLRHNYSGHLLDSDGTAITTAHTFRFSYWKSADSQSGDVSAGAINTGATNYGGWYETQSVTPNSQGYVSLELGNGTALPAMDSLATATLLGLYLQVEVKVSSASDTTYELLDVNASSSTVDRSSVLSVPFALNADMLDQRDVGTGSGSIPILQVGGVLSKAAIPGGTNSGSFLIDADGSESTSVTLQFGTSLTKRLTFDIANDRFSFSNDLFVSGGITATGALIVKGSMSGASLRVSGNADVHGTLSATGSIRTDGNLTINDDQTSGDASITFGQPTTNQTLTYVGTTGRFQFSRMVSVIGTLSGSSLRVDSNADVWGNLSASGTLKVGGTSTLNGTTTITGNTKVRGNLSGSTLRIDGNADIWGSLSTTGSVTIRGTLSGAVIRSFGLTDCDNATTSKLLWDTTTGKFSCGTDQGGGSGLDQTAADARYVKQQGGTMTGALIINLTSGTTGLSVKQTLSGSIIHADSQLRSSGSLVVNGSSTLKSTLDVTGNTTVDGTTFTVDSSGNKVGIGTSAPESALEVIGTASGRILHAQDELRGSGSLVIEGASSFEGALTFGDALADAITVHAATWTFQNDTNFVLSGGVNGLSFDTSTLSIDAQNDRVGIGTIAPDTTLEVAGTMSGSSLVVGGGASITRILSGTATLDFANTLITACAADLTISVPGAADGDITTVTPPNGSMVAGADFLAWVSSANTVSVRYCAVGGAGNPASGTFRAQVIKY